MCVRVYSGGETESVRQRSLCCDGAAMMVPCRVLVPVMFALYKTLVVVTHGAHCTDEAWAARLLDQ